jgi:hypothetical protein
MFVQPPISCETSIMLFGIVSRAPKALADGPIWLGEPEAAAVNRLIRLSGGETISRLHRLGSDQENRLSPALRPQMALWYPLGYLHD